MADKAIVDKAISDLTQALQITGEDLFVLQQNGEAKKLKGSQVVQYAKDSVAAEVQGVKEYADTAKASADAAAKDATRAEAAAQGIDDKVAAADASAKAAASSAAAAAASATGVDEKVQAAQTAATNAAKSETAAKAAQTAAANAQKSAESAQTGAQNAKTAAESAQEAAESAKDAAAGSSTAAGQKATQAAQSAEDAASAKSAAEMAKTDAQAARDAIVNMIVEAITLASGSDATVSKSVVDNVFKLVFGIPRGNPGADAPTITGITIRQTDYHMIVSLSNGTTYDAGYCRGAAGAGSGDMLAAVYDPQGKQLDIYKYVDDAFSNVPAANVKFSDGTTFQQKLDSGALKGDPGKDGAPGEKGDPGEKGADGAPGKDGAKGADGKTPVKGVDYFTPAEVEQVAQEAAGKVNGSDIKVTFTPASTRTALESGTRLEILFGKIAKWFNDLGWLAFKDTVTTNDVSAGIKASLSRADSALQSYTESDPTVPGWAKAATKPSYTASEVGALPNTIVVPTVPVTTKPIKGNGSGELVAATPETDYASPVFMRKVTLTTAGWNSSTKQQSVTVTGILADTTKQCIYPAPVDTSYDSAWNSCDVLCVAQAANKLTFQCSEIPTNDIAVYVTVITLSYKG